MIKLLAFILLPGVVKACCKGAPPDPTFIDSDEYYLTSVSPNRGTRAGGSRVTIKGGGFNVNFFTAGNYVYIGEGETWVPCDVIEGACSVQCGGPNTLICDTGEWTEGNQRSGSGWLDVKVLVEAFVPELGANSVIELLLSGAYYYYDIDHNTMPMLQSVTPHAASSEEVVTLRGSNLGYWIQDYRLVYVGAGRGPQGGNVQNGAVESDKLTTHALCRPQDLNHVQSPAEQDLKPVSEAAVMQEDRNPDPIAENMFLCALGDFMAGSYNVSIYMDNAQRAGSNQDSGSFIPGLAVVYDFDDFFEPALFSKDARGVRHMVQYFPRIDSVTPAVGSFAGGTVVTIEGGGFPMADEDASVVVDGQKCVVTYSNLEKIVCNTTVADSNATVQTKVELPFPAASGADVAGAWMEPVHTVGAWSEVASATADQGSYLKFTAGGAGSTGEEAGSAWVTFAPAAGSTVASSSGRYEALLRLPAQDGHCWPRASNVSVVVRSGQGYALKTVDLSAVSSFSSSDTGLDPLETDDGDLSESSNNGGGFVSLGEVTLLVGATTLITVDTSGAGGACVAVDNIKLNFLGPLLSGCTNPEAANFDASLALDDGSCLFVGGRGVTSASWSAMAAPYKLDDWYPVEEYETWGTGGFCQVPEGSKPSDLETCWQDDCFLHRQCGAGSFCCLSESYEGCSPSYDDSEGVDEQGWKLVFRHDKAEAGAWPHGVWNVPHNETSDPNKALFSQLHQLERHRRPADGRFEFKMCWPGSGFKQCQHWIQLKNPMANPSSTNTHAMCVDCPYAADADQNGEPEFRGLQYDGTDHLLDGDSDSYFMELGAENAPYEYVSGSGWQYLDADWFYGPQRKNDAGVTEYPSVVELYVRPDVSGEACLDCKACFDQDGTVRMTTFHPNASEPYEAPACPSFCLTPEHVSPQPRAATLLATHQLVVASVGLGERPCETIDSYDAIESETSNTTICEGRPVKRTDAVPSAPEFGRVGGLQSRAFFVAPLAANYTFSTRFDDGGELWLSPNADPRAAERVVSVDSASEASSAPGTSAPASSFCESWWCGDRACFRSYSGYLTNENAAKTCGSVGAKLGAPRSDAEATLVKAAMTISTSYWIGVDDNGQEGTYLFSDGTVAGTSLNGVLEGWSHRNFGSGEPNDYGNTENCIEITKEGNWNDNQCTHTKPFVCEIPADRCADGARSTEAVPMEAGEVRFLEMLGYNNGAEALSLLTLTVDPRDKASYGEAWTTSDVVALSSEFFREIRTDAPSVEVSVNGITAACGPDGGSCSFEYSLDHTPVVSTMEPPTSVSGVTEITITGEGFSKHKQLNDVTIGPASCEVTASNVTYILCTVPLEQGTAGTFKPSVKVFNKGWALVPKDLHHTIQMTIDSVSPSKGSLYGGQTLTLTGSGFARFGLHNQVKLLLKNDSAVPRGTHDIYDDDWLWQRGNVAAANATARYSEVLCVPRTMKNKPCRYTDFDSGLECNEWIRWAYDDIRTREKAEWFDFSSTTYIECVLESFETPVPADSVAMVNVSIANSTVLLNQEMLDAQLAAAKLNFDCTELSHCTTKDSDGVDIGWFGEGLNYPGATETATQSYTFTADKTPVITSISPERAMQGQLVDIHGYNLNCGVPVTDTNFYMSEFGFYYQPYTAKITIGTYECQLAYHNDTLIQCNAVYGDMYEPLKVELAVHGAGNAKSDSVFTFAVDIYSITPSFGSAAGGTTITIETSTLNTEAGGLGVTTFGVWFVEELDLGLSSFIADYLGIDQGVTCKPIGRLTTSTSLTCVTSAVSAEASTAVPSEDTKLNSWLIAYWNSNEVYSKCVGNCSFTYEASSTPVLTFDVNASHLVVPLSRQADFASASEGHTIVSSGDTVKLWTQVDLAGATAFSWNDTTAEDISISLNNASLSDFNFTITAIDENFKLVELVVTIPPNVPPVVGASFVVTVEPFGLAVVLGGTVSVMPVVTGVSHERGSMEGGLDVEIFGTHFDLSSGADHVGVDAALWDVQVGGRPCINVRPMSSSLLCTTTAAGDDGSAKQGFADVSVTYGVLSPSAVGSGNVCMEEDKTEVESFSTHNATTNVTIWENRTIFVRHGCLFQFSTNETHTPVVQELSARNGHWPEVVTISGQGFASEGNEVTLGLRTASIVSENATEIVFTVPKHVGGTYEMSVTAADKGFAQGLAMWFRFDSGINQITPKFGSRYAGQLITITGFGFAPFAANRTGSGSASALQVATSADENATAYAESFASWVNFGTANESAPFALDVVFASFDTIVGTTHLRTARALEGEASEATWLRSLSVDVAQEGVGYIGPGSQASVICSDGDSNCKKLFDWNTDTVYDGHGGGVNLQILYAGYQPFLLTDYQIVWYNGEVPSRWVLYGRETASSLWELVDTMKGPRTEGVDYKHLNRTVDNPGFYQFYRWVFLEWAPRDGDDRSDGHRMRDINLNPNGFAMHYGSAPTRTQAINYEVGIGLTNVASRRRVFASSVYSSGYEADNAVDGDFSGFQRLDSSTCALTSAASGVHQYLVVDLGKKTQVEKVVVYTAQDGGWSEKVVEGGGTVVGVSDGWDVPYGKAMDKNNHKEWAPVDHHGHYVWDDVGEKDCWSGQNCDTSPNVTRCGSITTQGVASGQHMVDCPPSTIGRYLFLYQVPANSYLAVCELSAYGYVLGNVTNNTVNTPQPTGRPSLPPSPLPSYPPSLLPSSAPTNIPSQLPSTLPSSIPSSLPTNLPSIKPSSLPTRFESAPPTMNPVPLPTATPTPPPAPVPTSLPTIPFNVYPTSLPSSVPTYLPSAIPTALPTALPSAHPTNLPSVPLTSLPSVFASTQPSVLQTWAPTSLPSALPSQLPTLLPSATPTTLPVPAPTLHPPTPLPSGVPTSLPSPLPTSPSGLPTLLPTPPPSTLPTYAKMPSALPSGAPTALPSLTPTSLPTQVPVPFPTPLPSVAPAVNPTPCPSIAPTFFHPTPTPTTATQQPTNRPSVFPTTSANFTACPYRFCPKPILGSVKYETVSVRYSVFLGSRARSRSHAGDLDPYFQSKGISWDDSAEKCARRGLELATVKSEAEQSALTAAVIERTAFEIDSSEFGSESTHVWLGAQRETLRPYWHWMDGSYVWENYTNWAPGFAYSNIDPPDGDDDYVPTYSNLDITREYLWQATDASKIAYLCMRTSDFTWNSCGAYSTGVHAYACEERAHEADSSADPTYERLALATPVVTSVEPSSGVAGTHLTITGQYLNTTDDTLSSPVVTIGGELCALVGQATAERVVCSLPFVGSGVLPVRLSNALGNAGPGVLPLVTVQHRVQSLSPLVGSLGGGQVLTISGENFPLDPSDLVVSMTVNSSTPNGTVVRSATCNASQAAALPSAVPGSSSSFTCVTSPVSGLATLNHYAEGTYRQDDADANTGGNEFKAEVTVLTRLQADGDELRLVSQGEWDDFEDNQRPGIYVVTKDSGVEGHVPGGNFLATNFQIRVAAMLYDPFTREVVSLCGTTGIDGGSVACSSGYSWSTIGDRPTSMISFLLNASPDYLLVVLTHHWYYHTLTPALYDALSSTCGGSDKLSSHAANYDYKQYLLVGRCNAGLKKGFSASVGLETKHSKSLFPLEIQFDPFEHFTFEQPAVNSNGTTKAVMDFSFDEDLTPFVQWISRKNGTTAGGTTVQLVGSGFLPNATTVKLAGVTCALAYDEVGDYRGKHLCEWEGVNCEGLGVSEDGTRLTCLTNQWDYNGDALDREVTVTSVGIGSALTAPTVLWSYANLWSSKTTWGGNDPPVEGDSVVITYGEYIILDISPPELVLLTIQGNLEFDRDVGDLALNCSYIVLHYGRLIVGTDANPFSVNTATITLVGNRDSYELPVYGAKTLAVRTAELSLHGRPRRTPWSKLAETAEVGNTTIVLRDDTDFETGDNLFITSTEYQMLQAEERTVVSSSEDGRVIELDKPLIYQHWGAGWASEDGKSSMDGYRASVGLLTRNVVIQGDDVFTKKQQFGAQSVMSTETNTDDNPLVAQFSNVEVRNAGQGLKLGKYPIHFHMVGNVSKSYVRNCSVHHSFNRGITIHGVDNLLVEHNVVFDTRGHTIFTEDGTERFNTIRYNLVAVVRPIWSVLLVDQSPACFWIVNPTNDVYGNVAGGSSHYGFWFRALPEPDGISGQATVDAGMRRCPNYGELGDVRDNTGHSTGRHGMKVSNFFPLKGGYFCPTNAVSEPATFYNFTAFKNRHMGIWGEFLIDVSFDGLKLADHVKSGIEFKYMNGRSAKFATTMITNSLFVGRMYDAIETPESNKCTVKGNCQGPTKSGNPVNGYFYPSINDVGNGWTHALHLPGVGSEVEVHNTTFANYQGAIYGCAWCVAHRGGYEMEFYNVSWQNVEHVAHFKHGVGGILVDGDGTLGTGVAGGTIVPPTGQWRTNPNCVEDGTGRYTMCNAPVRRVNVGINQWRSPWWDTNIKKHYPLLIAVDVTDEELDRDWDKWNRYADESRVSCLQDTCGLEHFGTPRGAEACFEQAPKNKYSFLAQVGRRYLITWVDQNFIRTTADVSISVTKMRPDEVMVLQFTHRPPLYPRLPMRASVATGSVELWGELEPRNGAWSPPPNIPTYASELQDHGGDASADPCAKGVYTTSAYPATCNNGNFDTTGGFEAPQIMEDPNIYDLLDSSTATHTLQTSGRSDTGGLLHPFGGDLKYGSSYLGESSVTKQQYRSYCMQANTEPDVAGGMLMEVRQCKTRFGFEETNRQRFKFGYFWKGDWSSDGAIKAASQARKGKGATIDLEIWTNALEADEEGVLSSTPVWEQPLSIVLAHNPIYCIDACAPDLSNAQCSASYQTDAQVYMNVCDEESSSQLFYFDDTSGEVVSQGSKTAAGQVDLCLGWSGSRVNVGSAVVLKQCGGSTYVWDEAFYKETAVAAPVHGAFYFDPYRNYNTRGAVSPVNIHNLSETKDFYKDISAPPVAKSYRDYTIWNTSVMSVVVAGNSTLVVDTNSCPIEGCDSIVNEDDSRFVFKWSDNATWHKANNGSVPCDHSPLLSHANKMCSHAYPCGCGDVTIWDKWVVTLDASTPFLNTLTIRGTLIVEHDARINLAIHANLIDIKGGRLIVGNSSHPFQGPLMQIVLHGDMYFHGKECTVPLDSYVSPHGCWKQIMVNGEFSVQGKPIEAVTRTLALDAFEGGTLLTLNAPVDPGEWFVGADLIVSSSDAGGAPEYFTVKSVSANGTVVELQLPLGSGRIGTTVALADGKTILDGRATVSLLSRNVEIRGGYSTAYDYISGVGPDLTDYGVTIRTQEAYEEIRNGWDESMAGFDLFGKFFYPAGIITNMNFVRFRAAGKMWDLEPPFREPPMVLHAGVAAFGMEGAVVTEPLSGNFFECTKVEAYKGALSACSTKSTSKTIRRSIFVGTSVEFAPGAGSVDTVEDSLFFGGEECRTDCPTVKMVTFDSSGDGKLVVNNNKAYGGYGGFTLRAPCSSYLEWSKNVAQGNSVGFDVERGCTNLRLEGYRNSAGITAATPDISNFLMVENGMAVTPGLWITWPTVKSNLPPDLSSGGSELALVSNGTVVGQAPEVAGSVRSANCQLWSGGGNHPYSKGFKLGGTMTSWRWFTEYGYSGFAANGAYVLKQGTGYNDLKTRDVATDTFSRLGAYGFGGSETATFHYVLDDLHFFGFSGKDSCGRKNVAISNEMAGDGEGTRRAFGAHFGKATCYPIEIKNLAFTDTPDYARLRFSNGPSSEEVAWGLCTLYDTDGSLLQGSAFIEGGEGAYVLKAKKRHEWPPEVLRDCQAWASLGYPDDYDGTGTCLWWLRTYDTLRPSVVDGAKRGMVQQGARGSQYPSASCDEILNDDAELSDNNVLLCTGLEYVILKTFIPTKIVSGSEVLYGPVGYINQKDAFFGSSSFAGDDTFVDIYRDYTDPRGEQMPPQTGAETETFEPVDPRYTQTYLATLVNRGYYRIQYTGDIGLFDQGVLEYQLVGLTDKPLLGSPEDEFAMVVDIKFMKAVNLAFYYDGRQVLAAPRRDKISLNAVPGLSYMDPVSKIVSFVVKGTMSPVRIRQLEVVSVAFGVVATFDSFFEDNFLDPNSIDSSFNDMVPPTYAANYDPEGGNIVKSNTFVRNLASVLNINPARLRVVNIVPGNRRRLKELAQKEPHKWKHLYQRKLEEGDDEGLGVDFEISSVDVCADVTCFNGGDCNDEGECDCKTGFGGSNCTVTIVNATQAPTPAPSSFAPTSLPELNAPTLKPTGQPTKKASAFDELLSVADSLVVAASDGTMDTGYEVSEIAVALPPDQCGVIGGNGLSCVDACGVANGDNSTCADVCGIPYGDGASCLVIAGGFDDCDHGDSSTGVMSERQLVLLRGVNVAGTYALSFNGATTSFLSVYSTVDSVSAAVSALDTIGTVLVTSVAVTNAASGSGVSAVDIQVEFQRSPGTHPLHYGALPNTLQLVTASLTGGGVTLAQTDVVCAGTGHTGMTYEEQKVAVKTGADPSTVLSTSNASSPSSTSSFRLALTAGKGAELENVTGTTEPILATATAFEFSEALAAMTMTYTAADLTSSSFELTREYFEVSKADADTAEWVVRFFFAPLSDGLDITVLGNVPPFVGTPAVANAVAVSVSVVEQTSGVVQSSDMPVSATALAAAQAAQEEAKAATAAAEAAAAALANPVTVLAVTHVCGDGVRTTLEACDDGGLANDDGCSGNCTVEAGFVCSDAVGQLSTCEVPVAPTLFFEQTSFGPFDEGTSGVAVVLRMGNNATAVSVRYSVAGSTAVSEQSVNDDCASAADFNNTGGIVEFAAFEVRKEVSVPLFVDGIWEQALSEYEKLVVVLVASSVSGAQIDDTRATAQLSIRDTDHQNQTLGWCLSEAPSLAPTNSPSHDPTPAPTLPPTPGPSSTPTLAPSVTVLPSPLPTTEPTLTLAPTPGTMEPTSLPSFKPTAAPTLPPSPLPSGTPTALPTNSPTFKPSLAPSWGPTTSPSDGPSLSPSNEPSPPPTPLPSGTPTALPSNSPTFKPSLAPSSKPTPLPTPLWVGLTLEASTATTLDGYSSKSAFDADQQLLFRTTLAASLELVSSVDNVVVSNVTLVSSRRIRRGLLATALVVDTTLTIEAEGATDASAVADQLTSQYEAAVTVSGTTSPFATNLASQAVTLGVATPAVVDSAATVSALSSMAVVVTAVSTASPSSVPTKRPVVATAPTPTGGDVASTTIVPPSSSGSNDDDDDGDDDAVYFIIVAIVGAAVVFWWGLMYYQRKSAAGQASSKVAPEPTGSASKKEDKAAKAAEKEEEKKEDDGVEAAEKDKEGAEEITRLATRLEEEKLRLATQKERHEGRKAEAAALATQALEQRAEKAAAAAAKEEAEAATAAEAAPSPVGGEEGAALSTSSLPPVVATGHSPTPAQPGDPSISDPAGSSASQLENPDEKQKRLSALWKRYKLWALEHGMTPKGVAALLEDKVSHKVSRPKFESFLNNRLGIAGSTGSAERAEMWAAVAAEAAKGQAAKKSQPEDSLEASEFVKALSRTVTAMAWTDTEGEESAL